MSELWIFITASAGSSLALQIRNALKLEETRECFDAAGFHIFIIRVRIPERTASYSLPL